MITPGRTSEAWHVLEPHEYLCVVFGPDDEMTAELAEALTLIRLDLDRLDS
ncbi:hypothetical protein ACFWIO_18900 [Streptomyces diastatochromogenes]|uniref:hypothetical protein n=1 Tax=Streptomyces diastatochromogenes TaxID=42236 RepID=UPI00364EFE68